MVLKWLSHLRKKPSVVKTEEVLTDEAKDMMEDVITELVEMSITPLEEVKGIGKVTVAKFFERGIATVEELLDYHVDVLIDEMKGLFTPAQLKKYVAMVKAH